MARKVYITSSMAADDSIAQIAEEDATVALMWPWLLTAFDDWGRLRASARQLKNAVFPSMPAITPETVEDALQRYAGAGLLFLYEVGGRRYALIPPDKWFAYQTHIRGEKRQVDKSKCPAPPSDAQARATARECVQPREDAGICTPSPSPSPSPSKTRKPSSTNEDAPPAGGKPSDGRARALIAHYCDAYERLRGVRPAVTGKDAGAVKQVTTAVGDLDLLKTAVDSFLASSEPFATKSGHPLSLFCKDVNRWLSETKGHRQVIPFTREQAALKDITTEEYIAQMEGRK